MGISDKESKVAPDRSLLLAALAAATVVLLFAVGFPWSLNSYCRGYAQDEPVGYFLPVEGEALEASTAKPRYVRVQSASIGIVGKGQAQKPYSKDTAQGPGYEPGNWWRHFWCEVNASDYFIALFTLALSAFTSLLWLSTHRLWKAGERQIEAANLAAASAKQSADALVASERAYIHLSFDRQEIEEPTDRHGVENYQTAIKLGYRLNNVGRTPATITGVTIWPEYARRPDPDYVPAAHKGAPIGKIIAATDHASAPFETKLSVSKSRLDEITRHQVYLWVICDVRYLVRITGTSAQHRSVFRWNRKGRFLSWKRIEDLTKDT